MNARCWLLGFGLLVALALSPPSVAGEDQDSPWRESQSIAKQIRATQRVLVSLERKVELMELSTGRYADWRACVRGVPVSEYGDPDRQFGYLYDEGDGTGLSRMPALAVDRTRSAGKEDYLFLSFADTRACRSNAPLPGGTADTASTSRPMRANAAVARRPPRRQATLRRLERRVVRLKLSATRLERAAERFDVWESCVSWVPVTEYGDPDGGFGYLFGRRATRAFEYRPALAIDRSDCGRPGLPVPGVRGR